MTKGTIKRRLKHEFIGSEMQELGTAIASAVAETEALESEKKAVVADFNGQIEAFKALAKSAAVKLNNGYEFREVLCNIVMNYELKTVQIWTPGVPLTLVDERPMTIEELQLPLIEEAVAESLAFDPPTEGTDGPTDQQS